MHETFAVRGTQDDAVNPARVLVEKLVEAMESVENLPVYNFNTAAGNTGLQGMTRRLRFRLKLLSGDSFVFYYVCFFYIQSQ